MVSNDTITSEENAFLWRSLLEGKPRRATREGVTVHRDCCDIVVKFLRTPSPVVPAVAFSIKRQLKAKLGSMATLSAPYSYLAIGENALALSIVIFMAWELWRKEEKRTLPAGMCLAVWCLEVVYHEVTCKRAFHLEEEVHRQSYETCRSRTHGLGKWEPLLQPGLVITDLILGSLAEAAVTGLASIGKGANFWAKLSSNNKMQQLGVGVHWLIAVCIMPMAILRSGRKYIHDWWNSLWNRSPEIHNASSARGQLSDCIANLQELQDLVRRNPDEISTVQRIMYPSISGPITASSSVEAPNAPGSAPVTCYSLTALEAVFFSQLLGEAAAALSLAIETDELRSLLHVWRSTSNAFKAGMIDSSWLAPNISRAMWHAATFEQTKDWEAAVADVGQVLKGDINPSASSFSSSADVTKAGGKGMASLVAAHRAVMHMISHSEPQQSRKVEWAMRAGLFAVVAFCQNWGGPEMVAVPGPLEHECLMACFVAPAFKTSNSSPPTVNGIP